MRTISVAVSVSLLLLALGACGGDASSSQEQWQVVLVDPAGQPIDLRVIDDVPGVVRFGPAPDQVEPLRMSFSRGEHQLKLPALEDGDRYEIRIPGYQPVGVTVDPRGGVIPLRPGYPVDVVWPEGAVMDAGYSLAISVRWRGPGDLPDALIRDRLQCGGIVPGDPGVQRQPGLRQVVHDVTKSRTIRIRVPWPGAYRLTWGKVRYRLREGPGSFQLSSSGSFPPGDGVAIQVSDLDEPVRVVLPVD